MSIEGINEDDRIQLDGIEPERLLRSLDVSVEAETKYFQMLRDREITRDTEVLNELLSAGLLEKSNTGFSLVPASELLRRQAEDHVSTAKRLAEFARDTEHLERRSLDGIEIAQDHDRIIKFFDIVVDSAEEELRGFERPPLISPRGGRISAQIRVLSKGVRNRFIYEPQVLLDDSLNAGLMESMKAGEEARITVRLPFRMIIADEAG